MMKLSFQRFSSMLRATFLLALTFSVLFIAIMPDAYAQTAGAGVKGQVQAGQVNPAADPPLSNPNLRTGASNFCPHQGIFTARIVKCVQTALDRTVMGSNGDNGYLRAFSDYMRPIIVLAVTLALVLMGRRIMTGEKEINPKLFGLIFKIGIILWLTNDFGGLMPMIYGTMTDLQNIVTSQLIPTSAQCPIDSASPMAVWTRLDCLVGKFFGFGEKTMLYNGMVGMAGAALFSGTSGLQLFFTGFSAMIMIMMMIFRAVYTFLLAYTAIAFLVIISPLIIPLMAFDRTLGMFYKWVNNFVSAIVEPMLLFALLSFFFGAMDAIMGDFTRLGHDAFTAMRPNTPIWSTNIMFDPEQWGQLASGEEGRQLQKAGDAINPLQKGTTNIGDIARFTTLDFGANHNSRVYQIVVTTISLILVTYLMMTMISMVPMWARQLIGIGEHVGTGSGLAYGVNKVPAEDKMQAGLNAAKTNATNAARQAGGGGGLEGLGSFFTGLRNIGRVGR